MIVGIGIDIIEISRIERMLDEYGNNFANRVFTDNERAYCESKARKSMHYGARFAAKEAFLKALGTGLVDGIAWRDIEVLNNDAGQPEIRCSGVAKVFADNLGVARVHLSISHSKEYAAAIVILEF